jgi:hypothetical protein
MSTSKRCVVSKAIKKAHLFCSFQIIVGIHADYEQDGKK